MIFKQQRLNFFHIPFNVSKFTESDQEFLTKFNFELANLTQTQFEESAQLLTVFKQCYAMHHLISTSQK